LPHPAIPPLEGNFDLKDNEVHIWHVQIQHIGLLFPWDTLLNDQEKLRASHFHFSKDRTCFVTCRGILRALLASYIKSDPHHLLFETSDKGKPALRQPGIAKPVQFNISHSGNMALIGFARGRAIGVDLEQIRTDFEVEPIAERFFSAAEKAALSQVPHGSRHSIFFHAWTRKEAFLKAKGGGLSMPLADFDVSVLPALPAKMMAIRTDPTEVDRWHLESLHVADNYSAALVVAKAVNQKVHVKVQTLRLET
jgi:4'-phosphopantetheinyl transferase